MCVLVGCVSVVSVSVGVVSVVDFLFTPSQAVDVYPMHPVSRR